MEFSRDEACDLNTAWKRKSNQNTNEGVQATSMPLFLNFEFLKMPDYWPQASVVKHRMWIHYVHFTYTAPSCLAIHLPISGHVHQKVAEIYRGKKDSEDSNIMWQHFQIRCRCWCVAKNSTYSIYNRVWHYYRRKISISLLTANNDCHTWGLVQHYSVHTPMDFQSNHMMFYLRPWLSIQLIPPEASESFPHLHRAQGSHSLS